MSGKRVGWIAGVIVAAAVVYAASHVLSGGTQEPASVLTPAAPRTAEALPSLSLEDGNRRSQPLPVPPESTAAPPTAATQPDVSPPDQAMVAVVVDVTDDLGTAVASASVVDSRATARPVETDADGRCRFGAKRGETFKVAVRHPRYRIARQEVAVPDDLPRDEWNVSVVLGRGLDVSLRVTDPVGRSIPGASVRLRSSISGSSDGIFVGSDSDRAENDNWEMLGGIDIATGLTDEEGRCTLSGVAVGDHILTVSAAGFAPVTRPDVHVDVGASDLGLVVLNAEFGIYGLVANDAGPLEGAKVHLIAGSEYLSAVTDADGIFLVKPVPPATGAGELVVQHPGQAAVYEPSVSLDGGQLMVRMPPAKDVELSVYDAVTGKAFFGSIKVTRQVPRGLPSILCSCTSTLECKEAQALLEDVESYLMAVTFDVDGYAPVKFDWPPPDWVEGDPLSVPLMPPEPPFFVAVTDSGTGGVIANAEVRADGERVGAQGRVYSRAKRLTVPFDTDLQCYVVPAAALDGAAEETLGLIFSAPGYADSPPLVVVDKGVRLVHQKQVIRMDPVPSAAGPR